MSTETDWKSSRLPPGTPIKVARDAASGQQADVVYVRHVNIRFPYKVDQEVAVDGQLYRKVLVKSGDTPAEELSDAQYWDVFLTQEELYAVPGGKEFVKSLQDFMLAKYEQAQPPAAPAP